MLYIVSHVLKTLSNLSIIIRQFCPFNVQDCEVKHSRKNGGFMTFIRAISTLGDLGTGPGTS